MTALTAAELHRHQDAMNRALWAEHGQEWEARRQLETRLDLEATDERATGERAMAAEERWERGR